MRGKKNTQYLHPHLGFKISQEIQGTKQIAHLEILFIQLQYLPTGFITK